MARSARTAPLRTRFALGWLGVSVLACTSVGRGSRDVGLTPDPSATLAATIAVSSPETAAPIVDSVVVIALDGVRWQDVVVGATRDDAGDEGEHTPRLQALVRDEGAGIGGGDEAHGVFASGPRFVSLPGYVEMMTGRRDTGCTSNDDEGTRFPTLADDFASRPGGAAVVASWSTIARAASTSGRALVSAGRTQRTGDYGPLSERAWRAGRDVEPSPGFGDYRPDQATAALALAVLREKKPGFLFIGLGDTDEHAHHGDRARYLDALARADRVIGAVADELAEQRLAGRSTLLVVTTDHGRSQNFADHGDAPESGRVWMVAAGNSIRARGWFAPSTTRYLADLAPTIRELARMPAPASQQGAVLSELLAPRETQLALGRELREDDLREAE